MLKLKTMRNKSLHLKKSKYLNDHLHHLFTHNLICCTDHDVAFFRKPQLEQYVMVSSTLTTVYQSSLSCSTSNKNKELATSKIEISHKQCKVRLVISYNQRLNKTLIVLTSYTMKVREDGPTPSALREHIDG